MFFIEDIFLGTTEKMNLLSTAVLEREVTPRYPSKVV